MVLVGKIERSVEKSGREFGDDSVEWRREEEKGGPKTEA